MSRSPEHNAGNQWKAKGKRLATTNFFVRASRIYKETLRLFQGFAYQMAQRHRGHLYTYADGVQGNPERIRDMLRAACERAGDKENGVYRAPPTPLPAPLACVHADEHWSDRMAAGGGQAQRLDWQAEVVELVRVAVQTNAHEGIQQLARVRMNYPDAALLMERELTSVGSGLAVCPLL
jgi:hypothetical protein